MKEGLFPGFEWRAPEKAIRSKWVWLWLPIALLFFFLLMDTGLHGDDYSEIPRQYGVNLIDWVQINGFALFFPSSYYGFWWAYHCLGYEHQWVYDVVKWVAHLVSSFFIVGFARQYFPVDRAIMFALFFLLSPLHDTTMYWYMTVPYVFFPSLLMYSHMLVNKGRLSVGFLLTFVGAFSYYFSPPYVFGLSVIFLLERQWKKAVLYVTPGILYVCYYFWIKVSMPGVERRIDSHLGVIGYAKQFAIQALSFVESAIGPSYWLKVFYAIGSLGLVSGVLAIGVSSWFVLKADSFSSSPKFPKTLFLGTLAVLVLSMMMYALTGLYPQSPFNLGNRGLVYGSLMLAVLVSIIPLNRKTAVVLSICFVLPVFGLSQHWKDWNRNQKTVIEHIHENPQLASLDPRSTVFVTGNIYSRLGPFSHIELFSMPWVVNSIFHDYVPARNEVALTSYLKYEDGVIVDPKFGGHYELDGPVYLYDSEKDALSPLPKAQVAGLVGSQPLEIRHWVQLARGSWVESMIVSLNPRLGYLFGKE